VVIPIDSGGRDVLYDIYLAIREIARKVSDIAASVEDVPVIGELLVWPLRSLSSFLFATSNVWIDFYHAYFDLMDAIKAVLNGEEIAVILDILFPSWRAITAYPLQWLLDVVRVVFPTVEALVFTPLNWLRDRLIEAYPDLGVFLSDPTGWLLDFLLSRHASWGEMLDNPEGFITSLIAYYVGEWGEFIADPLAYFRNILGSILGVEPAFWDDPWGSLLEILLEALDSKRASLKTTLLSVGEKVLRMLWEGV